MNSLLLPFLGNTMFIPFTSIILDAIVCDHRAQGSYYVWRDCYTNCWTDFHYYHVIMGGVALGLYEPLAVLSRPLW